MKKSVKKTIITIIMIILIGIIAWLGYSLYTKNQESIIASENMYNQALYQLVDYMQNVESYLAKATISTGARHGAETLTNLWREANLAQTYLAMLPIESKDSGSFTLVIVLIFQNASEYISSHPFKTV